MKHIIAFGVLIGLLVAVPGVMAQLPVDHATAKVKVLISDHWFFPVNIANKSYWEPFTDIFGDGTIAVCAGTFPQDEDGMNCKVGFINPDGTIAEYWGFYADDGKPFTANINYARQDGNPPRIACDRRPGGTRYMVGQETTAFQIQAFRSDTRWDQFAYDAQMAACQLHEKTAAGPKPITKVFDPIYGAGLAGAQGGQQIRFGGEMVSLSNGNFVVVPEDRSKNLASANAAIATLFDGQTGKPIKGPFVGTCDESAREIWSNVAAFKGGFCIRASGLLTVYDNDGNMRYCLNQDEFTTASDKGRSDGTRIAGAHGSNYIYIFGGDADKNVVLARFDAVNSAQGNIVGIKEVIVNPDEYWDPAGIFDRAEVAVDDFDNACVVWEEKLSSAAGADQIVARIYNSDMEPVTPVFYAFANHDAHDAAAQEGFVSKESNVSMDNQRIVIAANGVTKDEAGYLTPDEQNFAIVLENPLKKVVSIPNWEIH